MAGYRSSHYYKDKKYFHLLSDYAQSGDGARVETELKYLSRDNNIPDGSDAFYFINEVAAIAGKFGHKKIINKCRDLGNQIKKTTGSAGAYTSILEDALETESDCVKAFKESYEVGRYESVLSATVECIRRNRDLHIAVAVLTAICETNIVSVTASKQEVALYFIERVDKVIKNDIRVMKEDGLLGRYYSKSWEEFNHKDFKEYLNLRLQFKKTKIYIAEDPEVVKAEQAALRQRQQEQAKAEKERQARAEKRRQKRQEDTEWAKKYGIYKWKVISIILAVVGALILIAGIIMVSLPEGSVAVQGCGGFLVAFGICAIAVSIPIYIFLYKSEL